MKKLLLGAILLFSVLGFGQSVIFSEDFGNGGEIGTPMSATRYYSYPSNFNNQYPIIYRTEGMSNIVSVDRQTVYGFNCSTGYSGQQGQQYPLFIPTYSGASKSNELVLGAKYKDSNPSSLTIENINTLNNTNLILSFGLRIGSYDTKLIVEQSKDNGKTYSEIKFLAPPTNPWVHIVCDDSVFSCKNLTLRFSFSQAYCGGIIQLDDIKITNTSVLGVNTNSLETLTIFPNPTKDILNFSTKTDKNIKVYNLVGNKIIDTEVNDFIDVSFLENGVYLCEITDKDYKTFKKFIKN